MAEVKRGDIWIVEFHPSVGHEITKSRPALIIQNDKGNKHSQLTIVAPITTAHPERIYPTEALIMNENSGLEYPSKVLLAQFKTIDKQRLRKRIGAADREEMEEVNSAIIVSLGL
jgi:mRNA interferase MazF